MKRTWLLLGAAAAALALAALALAACTPSGTPRIAVETLSFDFGSVPNGQIVTRSLWVRNDGDGLLVVKSLFAGCHCTSAHLEPSNLPPGAQGVLDITFDGGAFGSEGNGLQRRSVEIRSNDPAQPSVTVDFTATIVRAP
jgi:hypothetical protein